MLESTSGLTYLATDMLGEGNISNEEYDSDSDTEKLRGGDDYDENNEFGDDISSEEGDDLEDDEEGTEDDDDDLEDEEEGAEDDSGEEVEDAVEAKEAQEFRASGILDTAGRNRKHVVFDEDEDFVNMEIPVYKVQKQTEEAESEDSDAVPEEATISKSKVDAARLEKITLEEVQRVKNKVREKRKKQHERNKIQKNDKRRRLEKLASKRLPSDLLEKVEEDLASKAKVEKTSPAKGPQKIVLKETSNKHKFFDEDESDDEGLEDEKEFDMSDKEDVISLKKGIQVKTIKSEENKYQALSNRAISFRQKMLYGKRQDRIPGRRLHEMKVKQEKSGKAKLVL
ncbi:uncharacterized protein LOC143028319 isoform X2 [Oratosquilla oratoria]|uniref:uncharacterized protein LOC143028319 isoform X2 n=1 Tax=Oratosquilla oratoria TaxID=337810 RepID=UPI003F777459